MKIFYGIENNKIDVTQICFEKLCVNGKIRIPPRDDARANHFGDPIVGTLKSIFVQIHQSEEEKFEHNFSVEIDIQTEEITTQDDSVIRREIDAKICKIHSSLKLLHGSFIHELPEQKMALRFIQGEEKVLEIGGNIGRNSLVIASILKEKKGDAKNLVVLESDEGISSQLTENRDINQFDFHIETSALSKRKLIQRGWDTTPFEGEESQIPNGFKRVNTITLDEIKNKFNISFDTLVLDCEGAFYYILQDMPEILEGIKTIIMENDYHNIEHKKYVDKILLQNNFRVAYSESGGWGPCYNNFFEVWKKY